MCIYGVYKSSDISKEDGFTFLVISMPLSLFTLKWFSENDSVLTV